MTLPRLPQRAPLAALSRNDNVVELYGVSVGGDCFELYWIAGEGWRLNALIGDRLLPPGTPVTAAEITGGGYELVRDNPSLPAVGELDHETALFTVDGTGEPLTISWTRGMAAWPPDWSLIPAGAFTVGTTLTEMWRGFLPLRWVARLYAVGEDGRVWQSEARYGVDHPGSALRWGPWHPIREHQSVTFPQLTPITSFATEGVPSLFATHPDGRVHWAQWSEPAHAGAGAADEGTWADWTPIDGGLFADRTPVTVIGLEGVATANLLAVDQGGYVTRKHAPVHLPYESWRYELWMGLGQPSLRFPQRAQIAWTWYSPVEGVALYCIAEDGHSYMLPAFFGEHGELFGQGNWERIGGEGVFTPGSPIAAVVRTDAIDLFAVGEDGFIWTLWWSSETGWVGWQAVA